MCLIKDMRFLELAHSSKVHTLGHLALLDLFFVCNPTSYGLGVERESFGGLVQVVLAIETHYLSFADGLQDDTLVFVSFL